MGNLLLSMLPWAIFWVAALPSQFKMGSIVGLMVCVMLVFFHGERPRLLERAGLPFFFIGGIAFNFGDAILYLSFIWVAAIFILPALLGKEPALLVYFTAKDETPSAGKIKTLHAAGAVWGVAAVAWIAGVYFDLPAIPAAAMLLATGFSIYTARKPVS